ncbi:MAG: type II secretion system F family protein [Atopobiaceae bacterium]|nr:type II secretion system F family protein [Atopobiaceae bacterium]
MEVIYLASCACSLVVGALIVSGGSSNRHATGWVARLVHRYAKACCTILGETTAIRMVLGIPSWRAASEALSRGLRERDLYLGRESSCAALVALTTVASVAGAVMARSPWGSLAVAVGLSAGMAIWNASRVRARERALIDEMPEVFRTLAMALGSGETLMQAIEYVGVHERGYAGEAFVQAALRLRCGASTDEAMHELARELDAPGVGLLTTALTIAQRTGSPLRGLFQNSAQLVERQGEYERMLSVKTAQVRLSVRIVCLLPLMLVCLLSLISVDFQHGLSTPAGMASLLLATAMDGCALLIIRRLMRGVL